MNVTIDANVWIGALERSDVFHDVCRAVLRKAARAGAELFSPFLLQTEIAASVARRTGNAGQGERAAAWATAFPRQNWRALDGDAVKETVRLAARLSLRGADAVYAAVAVADKSLLITCDAELLARSKGVFACVRPEDFL